MRKPRRTSDARIDSKRICAGWKIYGVVTRPATQPSVAVRAHKPLQVFDGFDTSGSGFRGDTRTRVAVLRRGLWRFPERLPEHGISAEKPETAAFHFASRVADTLRHTFAELD